MNIKHFFGVEKPKPTKSTKPKESNQAKSNVSKEPTYIGHEEVLIDEINETQQSNQPDIFAIGKYNLYQMVLKKQKKQKKNYQIMVKHQGQLDKIKFTQSWLKCPFGVEEYAGKAIINLEFHNHETNNLSYNNYAIMKQIDDAFNKLNTQNPDINKFVHIPKQLLNEMDKCYYSPLIKPRSDYDPLVRVHLKKIQNTIATQCNIKINNQLEPTSVYEIKGHALEVEFELSSMWFVGDTYGVVLVANRITILGN
jgi:hypothetical protein